MSDLSLRCQIWSQIWTSGIQVCRSGSRSPDPTADIPIWSSHRIRIAFTSHSHRIRIAREWYGNGTGMVREWSIPGSSPDHPREWYGNGPSPDHPRDMYPNQLCFDCFDAAGPAAVIRGAGVPAQLGGGGPPIPPPPSVKLESFQTFQMICPFEGQIPKANTLNTEGYTVAI